MAGNKHVFDAATARSLVELSHSASGIFVNGVIIASNEAAQHLGLTVGSTLLELLSETEYERLIDALLSGKEELRTECRGGRVTYVEWRFKFCLSSESVLFSARDVSALLESEDRIEKVMRELRATADEMEQFAYAASHDIQEPLRTITNYAHFLQADFARELGEEGQQYIESIVSSAKRCRELVRALLRYSRLTRESSFTWVDTAAEVRGVVEAQEFSIQDARATVHCEELPQVWGDAALLGAVFSNLISNALKFGGDGVKISVGCSEEADAWKFWVQDTGCGISDRFFTQIFNMFSRLDPSKPGVGVGLASCKKIVTLHGGRIWLTSKVGEGSTFFFTVARRHVDENPVGGGSQAGRHGGAARPEDAGNKARSHGVGRRGVRTAVLASRGLLHRPRYARSHLARPQLAKSSGI